MRLPCYVVLMFSMGLMTLGANFIFGQDYPNKPIRIVTTGIAGGTDAVSRLIAQGLSGSLGQPVVVDNRSSAIASETVANAPPDGYTLLVVAGNVWTGPLLQKMPYGSVKAFSPISLTNRSPNVLVVHPSLPVKSVKEFIALAKARPGQLNYGSSSIGGTPHLAAELFKAMASVDIVRINYKSSAPVVNDLISGHIQLTFGTTGVTTPHIKSGRLKALAVTTAEPSAILPGVPTIAETLPGYQAAIVYGLFAPAGTPAPIIQLLNQELVRFLNRPEVKERFFNAGLETVGSSPAQAVAFIESDMARLGKVIKDAGIRLE